MTNGEKIARLRELMKERSIDIYIVPTDDYHSSEYVGDFFKEREFISEFTGSAGVAVITANEAHLWTDGRYFIQAAKEIENTDFILEKSGEEGVLSVEEFVEKNLPENGTLGFFGRCVNAKAAMQYENIAKKKSGRLFTDDDLVDCVWSDRPQLPTSRPWILEDEYSGENVVKKFERLREKIAENGATSHLISCLYDIAYLTNLRADDIHCVPVFLSYLLVSKKSIKLYAISDEWPSQVKEYLAQADIEIRAYDSIYDDLKDGSLNNEKILLDLTSVNYNLLAAIKSNSSIEVFDGKNPSEMMRAVKNDIEIANTKKAHLADGVAVTKFIFHIKKNGILDNYTEIKASDYLGDLRRQNEDFIEDSFDTISAVGANAAMMHYTADENSDAPLLEGQFLLVDSGAHYYTGTTDITRTIAIGQPTRKQREMYTLVLKGHLRLMAAKFPKGIAGINLDVLARGPVWDFGLDYRCGTGHGVGHILNVHEGPNSFRHTLRNGEKLTPLEPGMITTDEPGIYIENEMGIRIENELLCVPYTKTEYGQYYKFEPLTYAPYEMDAIIFEMLTSDEIATLNSYNEMIYGLLRDHLTDEEQNWLATVTKPVYVN